MSCSGRVPVTCGRVLLEPGAELGAPRGFFGVSLKSMRRSLGPGPSPAATSAGAGASLPRPVPVRSISRPWRALRTTARPSPIPPTSASIPRPSSALFARVQLDVDAGRLPSCQLALARDGQRRGVARVRRRAGRVALRDVLGDEGGRRGRGVDPDGGGAARRHAARRGDRPRVRARTARTRITVEQVMLHTSGFPRAPFGAARLGRSRAPARAVRELAVQLGAGNALRVPPDLRALGARGDHRAVHRRRLPRVHPRADPRPARPRRAADRRAARASKPTSTTSSSRASRRRPTSWKPRSACASCRSPRSRPTR